MKYNALHSRLSSTSSKYGFVKDYCYTRDWTGLTRALIFAQFVSIPELVIAICNHSSNDPQKTNGTNLQIHTH